MPRSSLAYTALSPLDTTAAVAGERNRVEGVLELTGPESTLLAARRHMKEVNPLDFVYRAMGCNIQEVGPGEPEVPFILRYGHW